MYVWHMGVAYGCGIWVWHVECGICVCICDSAGKYVGASSWRLFAADVQLLVDNAQDFNDDDTLWFTLAGMV